MKYFIFTSLLFFNLYGISQDKHDIIDPEHLNFKELRLVAQRTAPAEIKLPFESIKILDSRFDTSKMGFLPVVNLISDKRNVFRKVRFQNSKSIAKPIQEYYNDYYKNSFTQNGFDLLIVMKRFWVSGINNSRSKRVELTNNLDTDEYLYCKWEYYLGKENKYIPLKRLDTIMTVSESTDHYIDEEFHERRLSNFKFVLKALIEIHNFEYAPVVFNTKPQKTLDEITAYNNKRYEIQVLKDIGINKGIYADFEQFKNNKPGIIIYKEKKTNYGTFKSEKYLTDINDNLIHDYWGYTDGEDFRFGKFGNDKIFRIGNTFQFFVQVTMTVADKTTPVTTKSTIKAWVPYQIDMETGLVY